MDSLPYRYRYLKEIYANLKCLKKQYPEKQFVNYLDRKMIIDNINCLELSREELANIGVIFDSTRLGYRIIDVYTNKTLYSYKTVGEMRAISSGSKSYSPHLPIMSTDEKGLNQFYFSKRVDNSKIQIDLFVPVRIPIDKYVDGSENFKIYWYNPTDSFINLLPDRIKYQLKSEKEKILNNSPQSTQTCTFFEVCKSTLKLGDFKVYPNPATISATVEFTLDEKIKGTISLISISGTRIKTLVQESLMKPGYNSFQLDLSGVSSGIYLISIISDKGFITQRIIISK